VARRTHGRSARTARAGAAAEERGATRCGRWTAGAPALIASASGCALLLPGEQRPTMIDRELISWPAAYARLAVVEGGSDARAPALGSMRGRGGAMIYVAASPVDRLGAMLSAPAGGGPTVLVVPEGELVGGHPRGVRASAAPALSVSGCQGFRLGGGRRYQRTRPEDLVA
ncbi:MAG: hypothetical protein ACXVFO_17410, partial [Solirubrobacteraceae bacterium]